MNGELAEREREILDTWPKFEDGAYVWFGDGVKTHNGIAITVEAIEFSLGKVCVKDGEDGDWDTSMYAMHPLKRPAPKVLDADGVEVHVGDTVFELETGEEYKVERVFSGAPDPDFPDHAIRCNKVADPIMHVFKPDQLTHTRPDSWERLEEDAESIRQIIACNFGDFSPSKLKQSGDSPQDRVSGLVRRAADLIETVAGFALMAVAFGPRATAMIALEAYRPDWWR